MRPAFALLALSSGFAGCERVPEVSAFSELSAPPPGRVTWKAWSDRDSARVLNRPLFLYLYSSRSYWCRDMASRSFEDPGLAVAIGRGTWPVRVDVDRRPDLAERFGMGGWPSTAILTPDGDWMTGSTYLDPEDLRELLRRVWVYYNNPKRWTDFERERRNLALWTAREARPISRAEVSSGLLQAYTDSTANALKRGAHPGPEAFLVLLDGDDAAARALALERLKTVVSSSLRDSDGTFFQRQLTPDGVVLDTEKTLASNAGWLAVLARTDTAAAIDLGNALIRGPFAPRNGFFAAGFAGFSEASGGAVLLEAGRAAPRDPAVYASWNALAVTGLAALYQASSRTAYLDLAREVLASIRTRLTHPEGGIRHALEGSEPPVFLLADQALVARAALDVYGAGGDSAAFRLALELTDVMLERLLDDSGALRDRWPEPDAAVIHAVDRLVPSGNGAAVQVLARLYLLTGHRRYMETAGEILAALANSHLARAAGAGALCRGMAMYLRLETGRATSVPPDRGAN
ncbi:MAG: DUF255 domain-containing protein [Gemmatimonadota bacterium]|nr:DUF255 domain-containing protein [Gemmatimonadota bacterium]